jgi:hypothetical protein
MYKEYKNIDYSFLFQGGIEQEMSKSLELGSNDNKVQLGGGRKGKRLSKDDTHLILNKLNMNLNERHESDPSQTNNFQQNSIHYIIAQARKKTELAVVEGTSKKEDTVVVLRSNKDKIEVKNRKTSKNIIIELVEGEAQESRPKNPSFYSPKPKHKYSDNNTYEKNLNEAQQKSKLSINFFTKGGPQSISPQRAALMIDFLKQKLGLDRLSKIEEEIIKPAGDKFSVKDHGDQISKLISSEHLQFIQFFSVYEARSGVGGGL